MAVTDEQTFNPDELYDQFPSGEEDGFGQAEGFNRWVQINDERLFTDRRGPDYASRAAWR